MLFMVSILNQLMTRFKKRPVQVFDTYQFNFFSAGLVATGLGCLLVPKAILSYVLLGLSVAPFTLPWLISPVSTKFAPRLDLNPKRIITAEERARYLAVASLTGYFALSNHDYFLTIPGILFETLRDLLPKATLLVMSYPLLTIGIVGAIFSAASLIYALSTGKEVLGIRNIYQSYLLVFCLGMTLVASISLAGFTTPLVFNIIGLSSFALFSIGGSALQTFWQHRAIQSHNESYLESKRQLTDTTTHQQVAPKEMSRHRSPTSASIQTNHSFFSETKTSQRKGSASRHIGDNATHIQKRHSLDHR